MRLKQRKFSIGAASLHKNKRNIVAGLTLNRVLEHLSYSYNVSTYTDRKLDNYII